MPLPLPSEASPFAAHTDQMGRAVRIPSRPCRIISLVPSQTELLFDLGLDDEIVGLTKFCVHPAGKKKEKTIIGGTKNFRFDVIARLQPDLIIGNKEENYQEGIARLAHQYPVWMSDIKNLAEACEMIERVGRITGRPNAAGGLRQRIQTEFQHLQPPDKIPVAYLIWRDPYMSIGPDTFIHDMLQRCGFRNVFENTTRYPVITPEALIQAAPRLILLSSEPYPFRKKHLQEFAAQFPGAVPKLVDGEMFSWFGSRLQHAPGYFRELLEEVKKELT
jgi:ABC-type Fe3+-hydroxamate transport system substrate-binding protein